MHKCRPGCNRHTLLLQTLLGRVHRPIATCRALKCIRQHRQPRIIAKIVQCLLLLQLLACDVIHLSGGEPVRFMELVKQRNFGEHLKAFHKGGGVLPKSYRNMLAPKRRSCTPVTMTPDCSLKMVLCPR